MTKLYVKPIDMGAQGSHKERKRVFQALSGYTGAIQGTPDLGRIIKAWEELEGILPNYLHTDDGSDVMAALNEISADQFDQLTIGLIGTGGGVPEAKSAS